MLASLLPIFAIWIVRAIFITTFGVVGIFIRIILTIVLGVARLVFIFFSFIVIYNFYFPSLEYIFSINY
jgi:hypothetical protein